MPQSNEGGNFRQRADVPLSDDRAAIFKSFLTPTPEKYRTCVTQVAVAAGRRPALESRDEVEKALAECQRRTPRLPLVDEAKAREVAGEGSVPGWVRLLANFPREGKSRIAGLRTADDKGDLKPLLKAQLAWILARQDRAWYAVGLAKQRLRSLGATDDDIYKLDGDWGSYSPADRSLLVLARKLGATPIALTDADVEEALKQTGPREVVQVIQFVTGRAFLHRVTEAANLPLDRAH